MMIFTSGISAGQQLRVAATDMYLPRQRGLALGFVATGSLVGIALSPRVMALADLVAARTGHSALGLPWLMMPVLILGGMILVFFVHPDPKEIGMHLERYYPGYTPPPKLARGQEAEFNSWEPAPPAADAARDPVELRRAGQHGDRHGADLARAVASRPLADRDRVLAFVPCRRHVRLHHPARLGVRPLWPRVGDVSGRRHGAVGALFVAFAEGFVSVTLGTFLVGLGWCAANVASTALIADCVETQHRGRAIGVSESGGGAMTLLAAVVTGPLVECTSLPAAGIVAVLIAVVPLAMLAWTKVAQLRGVYFLIL